MMTITMTANRQLLLWILYEVVLVRISEGTPFSDCRVDIQGPYRNPNGNNTPTKVVIRASESEPAVFYCRYTCHDPHLWYSFRLHIEVLDECGSDDRIELVLQNGTKESAKFNFTVTRTEIDECSETNNMTIFEARVYVGSNAPTLVAKCYMLYFPDGEAPRQTNCSSSSTFAIINNDTSTCPQPPSTESPTVTSSTPLPSPTPTTTEPVTGTNSIQPPSPQQPTSTEPHTVTVSTPPPNSAQLPTSEIGKITLSAPAFGLMVGILCAIVAIETLLLIIFVFFFLKYKKFRGNLNKVTTIQVRENIAAQK